MLSLTFDTQCLRYLDPDHDSPYFVAELTELVQLSERGCVDAARVGLIVERDLASAPNRAGWLEKIATLPMDDVPGVAVLGEWVLGRDVLGSDEASAVLDGDGLSTKIDRRDRLHLHAHRAHNRDIFVTNDSAILKAADLLAPAGISVMNPAMALSAVLDDLANATPGA